jgi:hypothetical protein
MIGRDVEVVVVYLKVISQPLVELNPVTLSLSFI